MSFLSVKNKFKLIIIPFVIFILFFFYPLSILSAGFQEEKLFDGELYSLQDIRKIIKIYNKEKIIINNQIKALKSDIDWLILKINQIQDSGRVADAAMKKNLINKENRINSLLKSKNRLVSLIQHHSAHLDSKIEKKQEGNKSISKIQLQAAITQAGLTDWVEINGSGTCLRIETTLPILFPTGSAKVAKEYKSFFQTLAKFLMPYDVKIFVNGYADTVPIHNKKYPSNFELGATRAANVVHQLVKHGLKPSIFQIESTGKYRFASKGMSKQKTFERRAQVTIVFSG